VPGHIISYKDKYFTLGQMGNICPHKNGEGSGAAGYKDREKVYRLSIQKGGLENDGGGQRGSNGSGGGLTNGNGHHYPHTAINGNGSMNGGPNGNIMNGHGMINGKIILYSVQIQLFFFKILRQILGPNWLIFHS
jgi:hypothetical protein